MKKGTIIAIILAVLLIVVGGVMVTMGLSYAGDSVRESTLTEQIVTIAEPFHSVKIDTQDCDVKFVPYNGDVNAEVYILEAERVSHKVLVEDGVLTIDMIDERKWHDFVGIFHVFGMQESMSMTLCIPNTVYNSVQIRTDTGDIRIPQALEAVEMVLRSSTGEIICDSMNGDVLDCMTSTGDITVQTSTPTYMKLHSSTGDFKVSVVAGDEIHMTTNSGEVNAQNVNARMFTCSTDTGDVELEKVLAEDYLQIFTDTGDVEIEDSDAGTVNIETDTGDVEGNFLTSKWFQAHSDTGRVRVPDTREGGECRIESNTGDIHFE